jgi:hypothetical protein
MPNFLDKIFLSQKTPFNVALSKINQGHTNAGHVKMDRNITNTIQSRH